MKIIPEPIEFEWDEGNIGKNEKHQVEDKEAEEAFFDEHKATFKDMVHSQGEERFRIIGRTESRRLLFVVFTVRENKVRVISARDVNKKEIPLYEEAA